MAASKKSTSVSRASGLRKSASTSAVVLGLSLATWLWFYLQSMPLGIPDTTVVVGCWLLLALAAQWAWGHFRTKSRSRGTRA